MRILFLSRWFPYPPDNGSKIRIFNILKQLSRRHDVDLVTFYEGTDRANEGSIGALSEVCSDVRAVPYRPYRPTSAKAVVGLLSKQPRHLVDTHSPALKATIEEELTRKQYDLVIASQLAMAPYAVAIHGVPTILEELELSVFADAAATGSMAKRARCQLTWLKLVTYLRTLLPRFAACTVVSESEKRKVERAVPGYADVRVIPNAVDLSRYDGDFGAPRPNTLVFCGALTYSANLDALRFFLRDVYPRILSEVPNVVLRVTGRTQGVDLSSLPNHPGVQYTGYVQDVRPVVAQSWVSVVPIRIGGGTRLKILESMALGTPVVSTSKGAEGLDVADGQNILIADQPEEFAARVVSIVRSVELRRKLAANGRLLVELRYDWEAVGRELIELVEQITSGALTVGAEGLVS